jgi:class 3 adenylate cyclase/tetratricopeptide (TPR) repeat protein
MRCSSCGTENPPQARFCFECAAPFTRICSQCGAQPPASAKFCMQCGQQLPDGPPGGTPSSGVSRQATIPRHLAEKILASRTALAGERKQVTVLFADITGSTGVIQGLDTEYAQQLLDGAVGVMMDAVHRFEGTVSRTLGDGIMALFGAPIAHEDHAVRACYAALALQDGMRRYAEEVRREHGIGMEARVGLNSGEVVVRLISDDLHMDYTAMGQTVHLASRLEQLASGGATVLSPETVRLVEGYVRLRSLGPVSIKGLAESVEAFELLGTGAFRTRLQAAATRGLTRLVGRQAELDGLHRALEHARHGHGQIVALVGEPGVGKSRLVWELTHSHRTQDWTVLEAGSVSYGKATSYLPAIDLLKSYCRIETRDDARTVREKLIGKLLNLDEGLRPMVPVFLSLLDVAVEDPDWETLDPAQRRQQTLEALARVLLRESQEQPLLLVFEDLHWIDSETQALLDGLVESLPTARILLLVNYRPEYEHHWGSKTYYAQIRVDPLPPANTEALLDGLLGDDASLTPLKTLIVERTEGNPFFLEESVRALLQAEIVVGKHGAYRLVHPLEDVRVPATVETVLAARIDRLPAEEKRLLQTAAVIGKDVPLILLQAIAEVPDDELHTALSHLQSAELLYAVSLFPETEYTFKHALTHEVAYSSLLQERRRQIHGQVVTAIERLYAARLEEQTDQLANHALRGECWEKIVAYCREAAQKASRRSDYGVAIARFEQALQAMAHLSATRERLELTFDMQLGLRAAIATTGDWERAVACGRDAIATAMRLDDPARLGVALVAPSNPLIALGRYDEAIALVERGLTIAETVVDRLLSAYARQNLGLALLSDGEYRRTIEILSTALTDEQPGTPFEAFERVGTNTYPPAVSRAYLAWCLAEVGELDQAIAMGAEAMRLAEWTEHPYIVAVVCPWVCHAHMLRGDFAQVRLMLERAYPLALATNSQLGYWYRASLALGHATAGRIEDAVRFLDEWLDGAQRSMPATTLTAAEACLLVGRPEIAHELVKPILDLARSRHERGHEAWALWLTGEVGRRSRLLDTPASEHAYRDALALSEDLGMRPLQARCHLGVGSLYRMVGRQDEARAELAAAGGTLVELGMAFWLAEAESELALATAASST